MSFILDALRKSQQARQPGSAPGPRGAVHNVSLSLSGGGGWLALGIVLLLAILGAAIYFWRSTVNRLPVIPPPEAVAAATASGAAESPESREPPAQPEKIARMTPPVRDLAEEAKLPAPAAPEKKSRAARPQIEYKKIMAKPRSKAPAAAMAPTFPIVADDTPLLQQMPAEFQRAVPTMTVTIHVFSPQESQRILFINNREYHRGDRIEGDIRVEEIVPDGVVLSFRGERFKLGRPR